MTAGSAAVDHTLLTTLPEFLLSASDIHGEYEHLVDILASGGVIDDDYQWSAQFITSQGQDLSTLCSDATM